MSTTQALLRAMYGTHEQRMEAIREINRAVNDAYSRGVKDGMKRCVEVWSKVDREKGR